MSDDYTKMGFGFMMGAIKAASISIIAIGISALVLNIFGCIKTDDSDINKWNRSGLRVYTDNKTGVQYLRAGNVLIPRIDANGDLVITEKEVGK